MTQRKTTVATAIMAASFAVMAAAAQGADLAGVHLPDHQTVAGAALTLNGAAVRRATILRVAVYVAGLYLTQPTHDAAQIVASPQPKLVRFVFLRNIGADRARSAWRHALQRNCAAPCRLPESEVAQFIDRLPAMKKGDIADVAFTAQSAAFTINGRTLGQVTDPAFVHVILLGYVGPNAASPDVRDGMLGKH